MVCWREVEARGLVGIVRMIGDGSAYTIDISKGQEITASLGVDTGFQSVLSVSNCGSSLEFGSVEDDYISSRRISGVISSFSCCIRLSISCWRLPDHSMPLSLSVFNSSGGKMSSISRVFDVFETLARGLF